MDIGRGAGIQGAAVALLQLRVTGQERCQALREAFFRPNLDNILLNLCARVRNLGVPVYFHGFHKDLPLTSDISIVLHSARVSKLDVIERTLIFNFVLT